jgi:hypothetical protein
VEEAAAGEVEKKDGSTVVLLRPVTMNTSVVWQSPGSDGSDLGVAVGVRLLLDDGGGWRTWDCGAVFNFYLK